MGEKTVVGNGSLYICGQKIGETDSLTFTEENCTEELTFPEGMRELSMCLDEWSGTIQMTIEAFTNFVHMTCGIRDELILMCPNKRVVHLARYAKKPRVKKKNYNHMIKLAEKEKRQ